MATQTANLEFDLAAVARQALDERQPGEDLDAALLRVCRELHPDAEKMAFDAVGRALATLAKRENTDRESTLRKISQQSAPLRVRTAVQVTTRTFNVGSVGALPVELRGQVQAMISAGPVRGTIAVGADASAGTPAPAGAEYPLEPTAADANTAAAARRCTHCGYTTDFDFEACPECGAQRKKSFWARLLGDRS